jgi:hypothetical protein
VNTEAIAAPLSAGPVRRRWVRGTLFFVAVAGVLLYLVISPDRSSPQDAFADTVAAALMALAALPTLQLILSGRRTMPFFAIVCALYGFAYGRPRFTPRPLFTASWSAPSSSVPPALVVAAFGVAALLIGYQAIHPLLEKIPRMTRRVDLERARPIFILVACVSTLIRLAALRFPFPIWLGQPIVVTQCLGEICMGGLLIAHLRGQLHGPGQIVLLVLMALQVVSGILTGALANAVWPVASLFLVYGWERRRIPFGMMIVLGIAFIPLNAAKHEYRARYGTREIETQNPGMLDRASGFVSAVETMLDNSGTEEMVEGSDERLRSLPTLAFVVHQTPSHVPYWGGESYADLAWHFVPRILAPSKPAVSYGQVFPRRYGLIDYEDQETAFNFPQLVEMYANFGTIGVIAGMIVVGFIYRLLEHVLVVDTAGSLIAATVFSRLFNIETDFADVFGGLPLLILVLYACMRLLPSIGPGATEATPPLRQKYARP